MAGRVEQDLRARLDAGEWDHYQALPTSRELAQEYGVSHVTVWKTLVRLEREGLLYGGSRHRAYRRAPPTDECSEECLARWHLLSSLGS
jgi:DNA-binding GntR family transcriptional regulator